MNANTSCLIKLLLADKYWSGKFLDLPGLFCTRSTIGRVCISALAHANTIYKLTHDKDDVLLLNSTHSHGNFGDLHQ
jgi:hypothetical protein